MVDWTEYKRHYFQLVIGLNQARVTTAAALSVLSGFPRGLPSRAGSLYRQAVALFGEGLKPDEAEDSASTRSSAPPENLVKLAELMKDSRAEPEGALLGPAMLLTAYAVLAGSFERHFDLERRIRNQHLVMLFAHLEAFLSSTVRSICEVRSEVLKCDKKISWERLVELGDWERVLDYLTERFTYESGWPPVVDRVKQLESDLGLSIRMPAHVGAALVQLEDTRNLIMHDGGRISREYALKHGLDAGRVGTEVKVESDQCDELYRIAMAVAFRVASSMGETHLGQPSGQVDGLMTADWP